MPRTVLRDDQWNRIEGLLPGKATDYGVTAQNNRLFIEAVLWIIRTGSPKLLGIGTGFMFAITAGLKKVYGNVFLRRCRTTLILSI